MSLIVITEFMDERAVAQLADLAPSMQDHAGR